MTKYSEIRKKINLNPLKDLDNEQAFLTHYLYNIENGSAKYFEEKAKEVMSEHNLSETDNIDWDIKFIVFQL